MASEPPVTTGGNSMIDRIKALLLKPKDEWPRIAAEPMTVKGILLGWVAPLAAIGPVAGLIGMLAFGYRLLGFRIATPVDYLVSSAVTSWLMAILAAYVLSLIIDALAPTFDGKKDPIAALKLAAYASTPGYLAGVLLIFAGLAPLVWLAGLYNLYLLYLGLPVLMQAPQEKAVGYIILTIVAMIVLMLIAGVVVASISGLFLPVAPFGPI